MEKKKRNRKKWVLLLAAIVILLAMGMVFYLLDYYHANDTAMAELEQSAAGVEIIRKDDQIVFQPAEAKAGLIFYPGGKVAYESYAPLLEACAEKGILCVIVQMPANLAVLDQNAADGIQEEYPQIQNWYLGGHSLGGTVAAIYLEDHAEAYDGLILLASYSTADLSGYDLKVLSIYGSLDGVMNREKYAECKTMLPPNLKEVIIEGGCHAYFGSYGEQDGDGVPTITPEQQQRRTVQEITSFVLQS